MKQSGMAKYSHSPAAAEIYQSLADAYAKRAMIAMDQLMHPTSDVRRASETMEGRNRRKEDRDKAGN
jgi:hypothetical protein